MKNRKVTLDLIKEFKFKLAEDEKSKSTIEKYMRDIRYFFEYTNSQEINKSLVLQYKSKLTEEYAIASVNSMLAALNTFFKFAGWDDLCVKQFKVQKQVYCPEQKELSKEEYMRLIRTAVNQGNERLSLVIQTICGTGIRVSELKFITVEAIKKGETTVSCKGKTRTLFIVSALRKKLLRYARKHGIQKGCIFVSKNGSPLNRSNIWRDMKKLCESAKVLPDKVFPHNLRHLFARTFYRIEKDIAKLADILGHSNINTTRVYIITTSAEHKRRMESMHLII